MTLRAAPPPIQPGVFRNVVSIRRLMDEAGELAMRASGGIVPSGQLCDSHGPMGAFLQGSGRGGRKVPMSNVRSQRLRALAVQKVSQAYLLDEIVTSVMVMKGTSTIDDLAAIVLKSGKRFNSSKRRVILKSDAQTLTILTRNMLTSSTKRSLRGRIFTVRVVPTVC